MAAELILLVRRWAKDRGVSHAAKGHLSPYGWMLLAIFYLQVGKKRNPHDVWRLKHHQLKMSWNELNDVERILMFIPDFIIGQNTWWYQWYPQKRNLLGWWIFPFRSPMDGGCATASSSSELEMSLMFNDFGCHKLGAPSPMCEEETHTVHEFHTISCPRSIPVAHNGLLPENYVQFPHEIPIIDGTRFFLVKP